MSRDSTTTPEHRSGLPTDSRVCDAMRRAGWRLVACCGDDSMTDAAQRWLESLRPDHVAELHQLLEEVPVEVIEEVGGRTVRHESPDNGIVADWIEDRGGSRAWATGLAIVPQSVRQAGLSLGSLESPVRLDGGGRGA